MTDVQKLIERLNRKVSVYNGRLTFRDELVNPDGPDAAALLSSQSEEVERLREALRSLLDNLAEGDFISETRIDAAREALSDEG